ncbi:MAG: C40 family peptidase [Oscillospiraceae bacterium]|nr:C40 family peptidase [Oscillospiraceae bacterium]
MPKVKERDQTDKVKGKGKKKNSGTAQQQAQRVMTAKLKKELVQQKRGGGPAAEIHDNITDITSTDNATSTTTGSASADGSTGAVEQVEQATHASAIEVHHSAKRGVSMAVSKVRQERQKIKERQHQPDAQGQPPDTSAPIPDDPGVEAPADTPAHPRPRQAADAPDTPQVQAPPPRERMRQRAAGQRQEQLIHPKTDRTIREETPPISSRADTPARLGRTMDTPAAPSDPTPGDRMLQRAVDQRKERLTHPRTDTTIRGEAPASPHYGGPPSTPGPSIKNSPAGNQSIYPSIKERPRRSTVLKEKPQAGAIQPKTRQTVKQTVRAQSVPATNTPGPMGKKAAAKQIADRARKKVQREAQRGMLQKSKRAAQATADLSKKAAQATVKAVKELISALAALVGGGTLAATMCVIFLVAAVIASPFGILFANEPSPGAVPLNAAVNQINMELSDKLEVLQAGDYSAIDIQGAAPDWREVAAVFACKTAMGAGSVDVAALTPERVERLRAVFWDMCALSSSVETIEHEATADTEAWTEKKLHITITPKSADDMRTAYAFSTDQSNTLTELLGELDVLGGLLANLGISDEKVIEVLHRLPDDLSPERRAVVETACKLVGKVNYFWGGKSSAIGWDPRWGTLMKVTSPGNDTSGTYRPFGLDCSGFLDWVLKNVGLPSDGHWYIGRNLTAVSTANAKPGDFALYPDSSHIGVVVGRNEAGKLLICHCASGQNNIVITEFSASGFTAVGKLAFMD